MAKQADFAQYLDVLPQILWTAGPNGELEWCSLRWFEHIDESTENAHSYQWNNFIHSEDLRAYLMSWKKAVETKSSFETEFRLLRGKDREFRWHLARSTPQFDPYGRVETWVGSFTDIHSIKQEAERLRLLLDSTAALQGALINDAVNAEPMDYETIIHTINRLTVPRFADHCSVQRDAGDNTGFLLLVQQLKPKSFLRVGLAARGRDLGTLTFFSTSRSYGAEDAAFARDFAERAAVAISNALLYKESQEASGRKNRKLISDLKIFEVKELLKRSIENLGTAAHERSIYLDAEVAQSLDAFIECDQERLLQVITILATQIMRSMQAGSRLILNAEPFGQEVRFRIQSERPFQTLNFIPKSFSSESKTAIELALAIARGIIEAHKGKLWINPDATHTFTFTLPLHRADGQPSETESTSVVPLFRL